MTKTFQLSALTLSLFAGLAAFNSNACSTIIVGKDVSQTGTIIVGHNESKLGPRRT